MLSRVFKSVVGLLFMVSCCSFQHAVPHKLTNNNREVVLSSTQFSSVHSSFRSSSRGLVPLKAAGDEESMPIEDRVLSLAPYILPLVDGIPTGYFIYKRFPELKTVVYGLLGGPIAFFNIPFAPLILFFGFSFLSRNPSLPRSVRFNMQQAILLDIALIIPGLFSGLGKSVPLAIAEPCGNVVYYFYVATLLYSIGSNLAGKTPTGIPIISENANRALGPF